MNKKPLIIGVLALQGSFAEHINVLQNLRIQVLAIKAPHQLTEIDGLILPGGESTTLKKLLQITHLDTAIIQFAKTGKPLWGTCAGAILLSTHVRGKHPITPLKLIDIHIERNSYGGQLESFEKHIDVQLDKQKKKFLAVFIRAPRIIEVSENVKILAKYNNEPVCVQEKNIMVSTFHPELTSNTDIHQYFLLLCRQNKRI